MAALSVSRMCGAAGGGGCWQVGAAGREGYIICPFRS